MSDLRAQANARLTPAVMEEVARQASLGRTGLYDALRQPILNALQPLFDQVERETAELQMTIHGGILVDQRHLEEAAERIRDLMRERDDLRANAFDEAIGVVCGFGGETTMGEMTAALARLRDTKGDHVTDVGKMIANDVNDVIALERERDDLRAKLTQAEAAMTQTLYHVSTELEIMDGYMKRGQDAFAGETFADLRNSLVRFREARAALDRG